MLAISTFGIVAFFNQDNFLFLSTFGIVAFFTLFLLFL